MNKQLSMLKRLAFDEDGGAYTLSYVMVVPFVLLFMCLVVETTCMLSAKLGTVYSAFAGARVATVWSSATSWNQTQERIEQAAVKAFVPFASGASNGPSDGGEADIDGYYNSYVAYVDEPVSKAYVGKKYKNTLNSISVKTDGPPEKWDNDITITVIYQSPFRVPGIGRLLGEKGNDGGYYFPLQFSVTLQNEGPQNDKQDLGIGYGTLE